LLLYNSIYICNKVKVMNKIKLIILSIIVIGAVALRMLLSDFPNVAPITALALFVGIFFEKKYLAFIIPAIVMLVSDFFIGFHSTMWGVYGAFGIIALVGIYMQNKINVISMIGASLGASLLFFAITNFAVWTTGSWYPTNFSGLIECYVAAIPFFGKTIVSDLLFTGVFVGGFMLAQSKIPALAEVKS